MFLKKWSILLLAFLTLISPVLTANEAQEAFHLPDLNESLFYKMVNEETKKKLQYLSPFLSHQEKTGLTRVRQLTIKVLKEQNPFTHIKELFIAHGIGVALTGAISEVVTCLVLPAVFTSIGMPGLATLSAGTPSFAFTIPAYLAWRNSREKAQIAKDLGIKNYKELDKLRKSLLGFNVDTRIMSVVIQSNEGMEEVQILKRKFARYRKKPIGSIIGLDELEAIVKKNYSKQYLELIKEGAHGEDHLYSNMLMEMIKSNPKSQSDFVTLTSERMDGLDLGINSHQQRQLFKVHEKLSTINVYKKEMRILKSKLKKQAKEFKLGKDSLAVIDKYIENIIFDLESVSYDIKVFEYQFLALIRDEEDVMNKFVKNSRFDIIKRLSTTKESMTKFNFSTNLPNNYSSQKGFENKLQKLNEFNLEWQPRVLTHKTHAECYSLLFKVLSGTP